MKGKVFSFNVTKGLGYIDGEDGKRYFVHFSRIASQVEGIRFLMAGWSVEFEPFKHEGKDQAGKVRVMEETGVTRNTPDQLGFCEPSPFIPLHVDIRGRVTVGTHVLTPTIDGRSRFGQQSAAFRAYLVGGSRFNGFNLVLPASSADRGFVLLDINKKPEEFKPEGHYPQVHIGQYMLKVEADGTVTVWNLGVRIQGSSHYIVVERRYHHRYDFTKLDATNPTDGLAAQTPTSGLARDNDGFIAGIVTALERMNEAAASSASAA